MTGFGTSHRLPSNGQDLFLMPTSLKRYGPLSSLYKRFLNMYCDGIKIKQIKLLSKKKEKRIIK